jgi:nucleotide-binding universal stress UspA family protein
VEQSIAIAGADGTVELIAFTDVRGVGPTRMASTGTWRAERAVADARRTARALGIEVTTELRHHADARHGLVEAAEAGDLLVLGGHIHSRAEGMWLGSTAADALHAGSVPVLVARPVPGGRALAQRVLVAASGGAGDRHAAEIAAAIAARGDGSVTIVHVEGPHGATVRRELALAASDAIARTGTEPVVATVRGRVPDAIVATADELEATLLVLGSRGLAGTRALASVSERVGAAAGCSVLVLRGQASADA